MVRRSILTLLLLATLLFLASPSSSIAQENSEKNDVEIEGLNKEYPSCALVQFSVRHTSQLEVYVEVYAEDFKSNMWTYADFPYDLLDPGSLYRKRVIVNPDMMPTGKRVSVTYDRCLKPRFVKETNGSFVNAIKKKDKKAASPVLQRVRVDVYILEEGQFKRVQQVNSQAFRRVPKTQPDQSPKRGNSTTPD